jgi:O-antigen/teichoic acid export membrane protein
VAAVAIASGAALALGLFGLGPLLGAPRAGLPPGVTRFALLNGASGLLVQVVHRGGVVAVRLLTGSNVQAGFAALAGGSASPPPMSFGSAALDPEGVNAATRRLARNTAVLLVPAALVAVFVVEHVIPLLAGDRFRGALPAFGPALALLPLAPLTALGNQASALRLRPEERFKSTVVGAVTFVAVAAALVPTHGALGATSALLAGTAATSLWLAFAFPDLFSRRSLGWALGGVAGVLALAAVT